MSKEEIKIAKRVIGKVTGDPSAKAREEIEAALRVDGDQFTSAAFIYWFSCLTNRPENCIQWKVRSLADQHVSAMSGRNKDARAVRHACVLIWGWYTNAKEWRGLLQNPANLLWMLEQNTSEHVWAVMLGQMAEGDGE